MSCKNLYLIVCAFVVLPIVKGQEQCMDMVQNFYQETSLFVKKPVSLNVIELMGDSFSIRPVASNMVLINQSTMEYFRQSGLDSLKTAFSAVVFRDTIIYGQQNYMYVNRGALGSCCDGVEYKNDDQAVFYRILSLSPDIMEEALGVIVFDGCSSMRCFQKKVVLFDGCSWELPKHIPQNEEITKRKVLVLEFDSKQIFFLKTGVRNGSEDIEYLYSCIVDVRLANIVQRIACLSNSECLEGGYYGF